MASLLEEKTSAIFSGGSCSQSVCDEELLPEPIDEHEQYHPLHQEIAERKATTETDGVGQFTALRSRRSRSSSSLFNQHVRALQVVRELEARVLRLEGQTQAQPVLDAQTASASEPGALAPALPLVGNTQPLVDTSITNIKHNLEPPRIVPQACVRKWVKFMNKNPREEYDYAIEILRGLPDYYKPKVADQSNAENADCQESSAGPIDFVQEQEWTPDRVRINSANILKFLSPFDKRIDPCAPLVMLRPFKLLVHYDSRIREAFHQLKATSSCSDNTEIQGKPQDIIEHVQCLIDFMDKFVSPKIRRFADNATKTIEFEDLYHIFQPGVDVYMPLRVAGGTVSRESVENMPEVFRGLYNMMWRISGVGGGRRDLTRTSRTTEIKPNSYKVNCYYIDFDGKYFFPTNHTFSIPAYDGEREITSLGFYPARFMHDAQDRLQEHTMRGGETFKAITQGYQHFYYAGWTCASQPCGCVLDKNAPVRQEYIESEVIVDFKQTLLEHPLWRPKLNFWKSPPVQSGEVVEMQRVQYWKDKRKNSVLNTESDYVYNDNLIDIEIASSFRASQPIFSPIQSALADNAEMVPEKDYILLPGRAFGFILRSRKFAPLWLWALSPIVKQEESLHHLQLHDNSFKNTVQSLVRSHFRQRIYMTQDTEIEYDVIRGKGKGLIILLHGVPGVGKTSTAESVAAANGKPLFQITCGDLGLTPGEVEKNLKEIFRFAQIWNCILLLDECEIFLTQRDKNDITRNALVSVFLRTLEFYTGVLFLTTNRVGVLDDAIKSRLTWTEYYPPLDAIQTREIWKINLSLLQQKNEKLDVDEPGIMQFAKKIFSLSEKRKCKWNGRQIQNAIKVATALAIDSTIQKAEEAEDPVLAGTVQRPKLNASHFETIAKGTRAFDDYLVKAIGFTEGDRAFNRMERKDDYTGDEDPSDSLSGNQYPIQQRRERGSSLSSYSKWKGHPKKPSLVLPQDDSQHEAKRPSLKPHRSTKKGSHRHSISSAKGISMNSYTMDNPKYSNNSVHASGLDLPCPSPRDAGSYLHKTYIKSRASRRDPDSESSESDDYDYGDIVSSAMDREESWDPVRDEW